jgi:cell division protein FtsI/penicillin-binding protein 2
VPTRGTVLSTTLVLLALPVLTACSGNPEDDVRDVAQHFLDSWGKGDIAAAAGLTSDADATTALLKQTADDLPDARLAADLGAVAVHDDTATVDWAATWDLAAAPDWSYDAQLELRRTKDEWRVVAGPGVVHPDLGQGQHLVLDRSLPERAAITDADGKPLFAPTEVVNVGVDKGKVTDLPALAAALGKATDIPADDIVADVDAAGEGQFVPVITLRRPDFEAIRDQVFDLPGAVFPTSTRLLAPTPRFALALLGRVGPATAEIIDETTVDGAAAYASGDELGLSGLQRAFQEQLTGTPGFTVSVESTDESVQDEGRKIASVDAVPGTPLQTPLVQQVELAAEAAVEGQELPTHLVAVRPGTGEILAVASSESANASNALSGQFPPGSSFKTVTATALLQSGQVQPSSTLSCPGTVTVEGREFENEDKFDLGTVTLTEAFAQSCNTTFIEQGLKLPDDALASAAAEYGIGTDWKLPVGIFSGSVPAKPTGTGKAAAAIGQGEVLVSPAQMALVAAGIAATPAAPVEVVGADPAGGAPKGPGDTVLAQLRPLMREVVLSGTATALRDSGEVFGKTGTAEFGDKTPPDAHGWFVGYQRGGPAGDIAFAVLVEGGQSSSAAVAVTHAFLGRL